MKVHRGTLAGNSPVSLKSDSTEAVAEPANEGSSSAFTISLTPQTGRFGFCEGIGNLNGFTS